jgi:hypothetical protein
MEITAFGLSGLGSTKLASYAFTVANSIRQSTMPFHALFGQCLLHSALHQTCNEDHRHMIPSGAFHRLDPPESGRHV